MLFYLKIKLRNYSHWELNLNEDVDLIFFLVTTILSAIIWTFNKVSWKTEFYFILYIFSSPSQPLNFQSSPHYAMGWGRIKMKSLVWEYEKNKFFNRFIWSPIFSHPFLFAHLSHKHFISVCANTDIYFPLKTRVLCSYIVELYILNVITANVRIKK